MTNQVFISYSHDDQRTVTNISLSLQDRGYNIWQDSLNLRGGSEWEKEILGAIKTSTYFILFWSENTRASSYILEKELTTAQAAGCKIIPVLIDGSIDTMPDEVKALQVIDLAAGQEKTLNALDDVLELPIDKVAPPQLREVLDEGTMTFKSAERLWNTSISFGNSESSPVGLFIERSIYDINTFLIGERNATLSPPEEIYLFMQFTGELRYNTFAEFLGYVNARSLPLWAVLVRGPIRPSQRGGGLEYYLPNKTDKAWEEAVNLAWKAIYTVSTASSPLHLFIQGPVALGAAFGAREHLKRNIHIYHQNRNATQARDRYFEAYHYKF